MESLSRLGDPNELALTERLATVERELMVLRHDVDGLMAADKVSIICFSGDWDRLYSALTIASGAAALGRDCHLFFTFWALGALFKDLEGSSGEAPSKASMLQRIFARMLPRGPGRASLSKMNYLGLGRRMLDRVMIQEGVDDIDKLMEEVVELGVNLHLCSASARLFGLEKKNFSYRDQLDCCGVATFFGLALESRVVLFI